jgi:hypothetical protein
MRPLTFPIAIFAFLFLLMPSPFLNFAEAQNQYLDLANRIQADLDRARSAQSRRQSSAPRRLVSPRSTARTTATQPTVSNHSRPIVAPALPMPTTPRTQSIAAPRPPAAVASGGAGNQPFTGVRASPGTAQVLNRLGPPARPVLSSAGIQNTPGRISINPAALNGAISHGLAPGLTATGLSSTPRMLAQDAAVAPAAPTAILTGGRGQQQCATCVPGQNYVLAQTNTECPSGACTFKFLGTPGCGSGGPSCWSLVSGSTSAAAGPGSVAAAQTWTGMPQIHAPTYGPSWSNGANFSDDFQSWLRASGDDPWSGPVQNPNGTTSAQQLDRPSKQPTLAGSNDPADLVYQSELELGTRVQDAISLYQDGRQFYDDVMDGAEILADLNSIKGRDADWWVRQENKGLALVSGATDAAIDVTQPRTGDADQDTMNALEHLLNKMPNFDPTLAGAVDRIKEIIGYDKGGPSWFINPLNKFVEQFGSFGKNP